MPAKDTKAIKLRASNRPRKIDITEAVKLRFVHLHSYRSIGDHFGVTGTAVREAIKDLIDNIDKPELTAAYKASKVDIFNSAERVLLEHLMDPTKLAKASTNNIAYALQSVYNMNRLESGKSTSNVDVHTLTEDVEKRGARIAELKAELAGAAARGGPGADASPSEAPARPTPPSDAAWQEIVAAEEARNGIIDAEVVGA